MSTQQRGVALLTAIILVAVAAIVATAIAWQSQLAARRGVAVFTIAQSLALAEGAEAIAAYALDTNLKNNPGVIAPNQIWAQPYGPVEIDNGAVLEASIEDQAGKFNLNNVVMLQPQGGGPQSGTVPPGGPQNIWIENTPGKDQFSALLASLNIDVGYAARLVDWIDTDNQPSSPGGAEDSFYLALQPPHRTPNMLLTNISELLAMGMDRASYEKLAPLVTALPPDVNGTLNVCTAPAEILDVVSGTITYTLEDTKQFANNRQHSSCYPGVTAFMSGVTGPQRSYVQKLVGTKSTYFRLRTWITIGSTRFTLYSLINQRGNQIRPIFRTFGTE